MDLTKLAEDTVSGNCAAFTTARLGSRTIGPGGPILGMDPRDQKKKEPAGSLLSAVADLYGKRKKA